MATIQRRTVFAIVLTFLFAGGLLFTQTAFAQTTIPTLVGSGLGQTAEQAGYANSETDVFTVVGNIIAIALGLLGLIAFILILYAGFLWMTASGDSTQVTKAKSMMTSAIIGMVIILSAFAITTFVTSQLGDAASTTPAAAPSGP